MPEVNHLRDLSLNIPTDARMMTFDLPVDTLNGWSDVLRQLILFITSIHSVSFPDVAFPTAAACYVMMMSHSHSLVVLKPWVPLCLKQTSAVCEHHRKTGHSINMEVVIFHHQPFKFIMPLFHHISSLVLLRLAAYSLRGKLQPAMLRLFG